jgi:signal peptidase I
VIDLAAARASRRRRMLRWLAGYGLVALALLHFFGFTVTSMASPSMQPTLRSDVASPDRVLVDLLTPRFRAPRRGEIVYFMDNKGTWVMKRVIGLPNEHVEIRAGRIVINGSVLEHPPEIANRRYLNSGHMKEGSVMNVNPDFYMVLGDDTQDSYDSRFWGGLPAGSIRGIARAVIWPPAHSGVLTPGS